MVTPPPRRQRQVDGLAKSRPDGASNLLVVNVRFRDVIGLIEQDGWRLVRTTGSHRQYRHPAKPGTVTVAGKPNLDVPPGTLNSILKQAGLKGRQPQ
jgi:predicted RNA binding protein YcfA (HicA-like mRNA interferase family)